MVPHFYHEVAESIVKQLLSEIDRLHVGSFQMLYVSGLQPNLT